MAAKTEHDGAMSGVPWRIIGWGAAAILLLVPLVAMQFTPEVDWTAGDFVFAGVMFAIVGGTLELAVWRSTSRAYRAAVALALVAGFLHVWITVAVGIIGSEANPGNLLYLAVVAIAMFGSIVALGRPAGMAVAMGVAAAAEAAVPFIAFARVADPASDVLRPEVAVITIVFTAMWLLSAMLFRRVAQERR